MASVCNNTDYFFENPQLCFFSHGKFKHENFKNVNFFTKNRVAELEGLRHNLNLFALTNLIISKRGHCKKKKMEHVSAASYISPWKIKPRQYLKDILGVKKKKGVEDLRDR